MPELRKDPVVGRWVIISTERAKRPQDFAAGKQEIAEKKPCPFCEGNESMTSTEIYAVRKKGSKPDGPGWDVRVVPKISPGTFP